MALNFQLRLADGITPGARSAKRSLDQLDAQLRVVDRDLDMSARRRAQAQARQLQGDRQSTAQYRRNQSDRLATARRTASELEALEQRVTRTQERETRQREALTRRELRNRIAANSEAARETNRRVRESQARGDRIQAGVGQGLRMAGGGAVALLAMAGQYGDEQRARNRTQQQLDFRVQGLASGTGHGEIAPEISAALERTAMGTGANVDELLGGLQTAQGRFGALNTAEGRNQWFRNGGMLDQLTRAAIGAQSSLSDVVATSGELQRQLNIAPTALPNTLAQMIVMGRQGSIEFADFSQHFGQLAGMSRRFLRAGTAQESAAANALTGTLFQTAGNGGLGGAEAATSTRALLSELTSGAGQQRLNRALGVSAFDAHGQLRAGQGQGQDEAFIGMVEQLYRRTGGNSARFTQALAGGNREAAGLVDQLRRDMEEHGGHLTGFRQLETGARGATAANTQDRAFNDMQNTAEMRRAREENRLLFQQNHSAFAAGANDTEEQQRAMQIDSPTFHRAFNLPVARDITHGTMDLVNRGIEGIRANIPTAAEGMRAQTPADLFRVQARGRAAGDVENQLGWTSAFLSQAGIDRRVNERASVIFNELVANYERTTGRRADQPFSLSPASVTDIRGAVREGVTEAIQGGPRPAGGAAPAGNGGSWFGGAD